MTSSDDEWEYEYHDTETETFLVDVDLSSLNGVIKHKNTGNRKTLRVPTQNDEAEIPPTLDEPEAEEQESFTEANDLPDTQTRTLQILEFDSRNPIVSYQNQVYSCKWSDMIGTNMFFSRRDADPEKESLRSSESSNLIGTSRIRLIGHKARLIEKKSAKKEIGGKSLGNIRASNPKVNLEIKRQASFLEKLIDVKRAKGDKDNVRTYVSQQTKTANARRPALAPDSQSGRQDDALRSEIYELNKKVIRGDADALNRLQEIMSQSEEVPDSNMDLDTPSDDIPADSSYPDPVQYEISTISTQHPADTAVHYTPEHHDTDNAD